MTLYGSIKTNVLTDGSETYDVVFRDLDAEQPWDTALHFPAVTLDDALAFLDAASKHTLVDVDA